MSIRDKFKTKLLLNIANTDFEALYEKCDRFDVFSPHEIIDILMSIYYLKLMKNKDDPELILIISIKTLLLTDEVDKIGILFAIQSLDTMCYKFSQKKSKDDLTMYS